VIGGGKDGRIDVLDVNGLARTQSFLAFFDADTDEGADISYGYTYNYYKPQYYVGPNIHGGPVAWDVRARPNSPSVYVYAWSEKDALKRFTFIPETGKFLAQDAQDASPSNPTPSPHGSVISGLKSMPGGMLSISANGDLVGGGIVWGSASFSGVATGPSVPGILRAFDATNLATELWDSKQNAARDDVGLYAKFNPPTVANGKVYLGTFSGQLVVYGLNPPVANPPAARISWSASDSSSTEFGNWSVSQPFW